MELLSGRLARPRSLTSALTSFSLAQRSLAHRFLALLKPPARLHAVVCVSGLVVLYFPTLCPDWLAYWFLLRRRRAHSFTLETFIHHYLLDYLSGSGGMTSVSSSGGMRRRAGSDQLLTAG